MRSGVLLILGVILSLLDFSNANDGCTATQGFWKTHPERWWVDTLILGLVSYNKTELLLILDEPVRGNGLISLAHQLIAAELNIAAGADNTAITLALFTSHALIDTNVVPPIGVDTLPPSQVAMYVEHLTTYNEGEIGPGECGGDGPPEPPGCVEDPQTNSNWFFKSTNATARITGPVCSLSDTFNISVVGDHNPKGGFDAYSFTFFENLISFSYNVNHQFIPNPTCACITCAPCIDGTGVAFGPPHSKIFTLTRSPGIYKYTYVYGVRSFVHGFFDIHAEIMVTVQ